MDLDYLKIKPVVDMVAGAVAGNFPSYITRDDIRQSIWVWVYSNRKTVTELMRDDESWEPMLYGTITRVANSRALEEDAAVNGYSSEDVYHYTTPVVRELLKDAFDYEDWQSFSTLGDGQPKAKKQANTTGDRMAMLADVKSAVEKLNDDQYNIILWAYKYGFSHKEIAAALECSEQASKDRLRRAVEAVRRNLGKTPLTDLQNSSGERLEAMKDHRRGSAYANAITDSTYNG